VTTNYSLKLEFFSATLSIGNDFIRKNTRWKLLEGFSVTLLDGSEYCVSGGLITDLASTPPILWSVLPPFDDALKAYLVHDDMYRRRHLMDVLGRKAAQKYADDNMLFLAKQYNSSTFRKRMNNQIRYRSVRAFGHLYFKDNLNP